MNKRHYLYSRKYPRNELCCFNVPKSFIRITKL